MSITSSFPPYCKSRIISFIPIWMLKYLDSCPYWSEEQDHWGLQINKHRRIHVHFKMHHHCCVYTRCPCHSPKPETVGITPVLTFQCGWLEMQAFANDDSDTRLRFLNLIIHAVSEHYWFTVTWKQIPSALINSRKCSMGKKFWASLTLLSRSICADKSCNLLCYNCPHWSEVVPMWCQVVILVVGHQ